MAKYIDAEKLKSEIKHLKLDVWDEAHQFDLGARSALSYIEQFLTSLQQEQQEDLEKEIDKKIAKMHITPTYDELVGFAHHFYELKLNTRKKE